MLRLLNNLFQKKTGLISKIAKNFSTTHHQFFDDRCFSKVQIHSLKTRMNATTQTLSIGDLCMAGIPIELGFYDSHLFDKRTQYTQASQPIVLILPASDSSTQDYTHLIDTLVEKQVRVLSVEFPGCGTSKFAETESNPVYMNLMAQKMSIVHDFLSLRLPNRKKSLSGIIGLGDNSFVIPLLDHEAMNSYIGHEKAILVDPAPPEYIALLSGLYRSRLTRGLCRQLVKKQIEKHQAVSGIETNFYQTNQVFNLYESWLHIQPKTIDLMLLSNIQSKFELYFYLRKTHTDQEFNEKLKAYFRENDFENFELYEASIKSPEFQKLLAERVLINTK